MLGLDLPMHDAVVQAPLPYLRIDLPYLRNVFWTSKRHKRFSDPCRHHLFVMPSFPRMRESIFVFTPGQMDSRMRGNDGIVV